ncbi:N-alpha-acetyltransferase 30 [Phytophthora nicotianae]|uniref:2,4-dienoyl-CoA reductase [(3E)-enoyl-CoA-producing] n=1 Tax=Phytophthora nicotianae TaxID=4792 RepID=A0A0W8DHY2_PHYNI|nr:N-alpha-acetyltransferase 30 [Phytophthora nicotianae]
MDTTSLQRVFRRDACAGRVALVTGGGSGIGQEIAIKLAEYGAKVAVFGRREVALQSTMSLMREHGVPESSCMFVQGDVRSAESAENAVAQVVARFGKLDVLVNSAAGNFLALAEKLSTNAFRTVMEIDAIDRNEGVKESWNEAEKRLSCLKELLSRKLALYNATASFRRVDQMPEKPHATNLMRKMNPKTAVSIMEKLTLLLER